MVRGTKMRGRRVYIKEGISEDKRRASVEISKGNTTAEREGNVTYARDMNLLSGCLAPLGSKT